MTDSLVEILYTVSTSLLTPALLLLMAFVLGTLVMIGGMLREAVDRRMRLASWRAFLLRLKCHSESASYFFELRLIGYPAAFQAQTSEIRNNELLIRKCLEDIELDISRRLSWLSFGTRIGPLLGLVGTLIPLGPALTGLASGDIQALSGNLVIAFTTTVFGILVGGVAFGIGLVRRSWYEQDLSDLELLVALWHEADNWRPPELSPQVRSESHTIESPMGMKANHA